MIALVSLVLSAAPVLPPATKWSPPAVQTRKLACGAQLQVVPQKGVPLVHVGVLINAGSIADPAAKPGLARLTATAVEEGGSGSRSADEVRAYFDSLGTELRVNAESDGVMLSLTALSSKLEPALSAVADVIAKPRFDEASVAPLAARARSELAFKLDDPTQLAEQRMLEALYGTHPRNHLADGTVAGINAITTADYRQFHAANWSPANTLFVLVGDVDADAARATLDKLLPKPWSTGAAAAALPTPAALTANRPWLAYDKPGAAQTVVVLARHGVAAADAARTPISLVAVVLGGSFTSRLVQNLREKHGYTYNASSRQRPGREGKAVWIRTSVKTEVTAPAMRELINELDGITRLDAAELEKSRALLDAAQVEGFAGGDNTVFTLLMTAAEGLAPTELATERARREKVTLPELISAAGRFDAPGFTVVLVGDRAKIEKELKTTFPDRTIEWH